MSYASQSAKQSGASLVEVVIAIVVLSIGLTGLFAALHANIGRSADPAVRVQATAIAQSYLEEVMLKPFCDPNLSTDCPTDCMRDLVCSEIACSAVEGSRAQFDDMCDYDSLVNNGAQDQFGAPVPGLGAYTVRVDIEDDDAALNFGGLIAGQVVRIDVTVDHATAAQGANVTLSSYKTNY